MRVLHCPEDMQTGVMHEYIASDARWEWRMQCSRAMCRVRPGVNAVEFDLVAMLGPVAPKMNLKLKV